MAQLALADAAAVSVQCQLRTNRTQKLQPFAYICYMILTCTSNTGQNSNRSTAGETGNW